MTGNEALLTFALIAGGFLLGGVMFSRALPKLLTGKDVCALRTDKNPGAANVFAVCGVPMGLLCLALDMLKAYLPVSLAAQHLDTQSVWFALALAAPVLGHAVGVFNGFHGGKCIASAFGAMLALGGLWLLLSSGALSEPGLQRVLAVLAVVTGVVFARQMLAPGERENDAGALVCASMPMVLLVFWLIVSYKVNIINPTISAYAVEILALCAALIAFYELAGFAYGRPKAVKSIFWSQFAAFLCITALPDDRAGAQQLMLVAIAGMLLFQSYLTASNIRPAVSGPAGGAQ